MRHPCVLQESENVDMNQALPILFNRGASGVLLINTFEYHLNTTGSVSE